jgi:glutathionylspermidine synthase
MHTNNQLYLKKYFTPEVKEKLNRWEQKFISSIYKSNIEITDKQKKVIEKIIEKYSIEERTVVEKIIYAPTGYAAGAKINQEITSRVYRKNRNR